MKISSRIVVVICVVALTAGAIALFTISQKKPEPSVKMAPEISVGWREDFMDTVGTGSNIVPKNWKVRGKPGTPVSTFIVKEHGEKGNRILSAISDNSTGSLITIANDVNLKETPVMRWRWRALSLPDGGDGRDPEKDDQAIGIYVGDGSLFNNKSVSYRWDTKTPVSSEGYSTYGMGTVKVKWFTLRNFEDAEKSEWFTESVDVLSDIKKAWGRVPEKVYVSITTNSQYTGTRASAEVDWIEFISKPEK
ncbi:MAG: DUF3047 domain-containing protein [Candidatus Omnitrophota bacterium]